MSSHFYKVSTVETLKLLFPPSLILGLMILGARALQWTDPLPPVRAPEFLEDIVIRQKSAAAEVAPDAETLFVGDSSCLMDFSARELQQLAPGGAVYNLGTLSTLGLPKFAEFTANYLSRHTNVRKVILLISPEMVRSASATSTAPARLAPEFQKQLAALRSEGVRARKAVEAQERKDRLFAETLALPFIKTQLVARVFQAPYEDELGRAYGFPSGVREFMAAHNGSAVDPSGAFHRAPSAVADENGSMGFAREPFRHQCEIFRRPLPANIKLSVGLTPEPASVCGPNRRETIHRTLMALKQYLHADEILTNLPVALPDHYFSTTTHLNPSGARQFTHSLAAAFERESNLAQGAAPGFVSDKSD